MYDDFQYVTDSLSFTELEDRLCKNCGIDYVDSSSTPRELPLDKSFTVRLFSIHKRPHKNVSCQVRISAEPKGRYTVSVYGITSI